VHQFIIALRQLRFPIIALAVAVIVLQSLVAGLGSGHAASRLAAGDAGTAVLCHGNGEDDGAPSDQTLHECCKFCASAGPAVVPPAIVSLGTLDIPRAGRLLAPARDPRRLARAIRAGPSQAPPLVS
jgi:hypothetical protein